MELTPVTRYNFSDHMTGETVTVDGDPTPVTIKIGDTEYGPLYFGDNALAALTALGKEDGETFRKSFKHIKTRDVIANVDNETGATDPEIRTWAKANGVEVSERARVAETTKVKFREAVKAGTVEGFPRDGYPKTDTETAPETAETPDGTETAETPARRTRR